jgi:hypothetical protein
MPVLKTKAILPSPAIFLHFISRQAVPDYLTIPGIVSLLNGGANTLNFVLFQHVEPVNFCLVPAEEILKDLAGNSCDHFFSRIMSFTFRQRENGTQAC